MKAHPSDTRAILREVLMAFPRHVAGLPIVIWAVFWAGLGKGVALFDSVLIGFGLFAVIGIALPLLYLVIASHGLGD